MAKNLIYDVHEKPKFSNMLVFALQQVLAILAATIAVPTIIGLPTQIPAAIFGAGVGTLVYQLFTKFKSPVFRRNRMQQQLRESLRMQTSYRGIQGS